MSIGRRRLLRSGLIALGAAAATGMFSGLIPAMAQIIGSNGGEVCIATAGETCDAKTLAVSNGGDAQGYVAVSTAGNATGTGLGVTSSGCAFGPEAVSVSGCAAANNVSVSGKGTSGNCYTLLAISGTDSSCGDTALSATGSASGSSAAISATGWATDPNNGCNVEVAVSVKGNACGHVDFALSGTGGPTLTGRDAFPAYTPPTSRTTNKEVTLAKITPSVAQITAENLASAPATPVLVRHPQTTASANSPAVAADVPQWNLTAQQKWYYCGPGSSWNILQVASNAGWAYGVPSQYTLGDNNHEQTDSQGETEAWNIVPSINDYLPGAASYADRVPSDPNDLLSVVSDDVYYNAEAIIVNVRTTNIPWFRGHDWGHWDVIWGYNLSHGGSVDWAEVYDGNMWYSSGGWYSFGYHYGISAANAYAWIHSSASQSVIW
jgi:hypothetical protein